jgi:DNA adenine methylase
LKTEKQTVNIKTPVPYYGGKQMMIPEILPRIPDHDLYTEAYFGGGAIFWAKQPVKIEIINDINGEVINFYIVLQTQYTALNKLIQATLHSRKQHKNAYVIYSSPELFDNVQRAWALWVLCNEGFATKIGTSWGYDKTSNSVAKKVQGAKGRFNADVYKHRLENTQIECNDAVKVIESRDRPGAFHYIDTPYFNSDCGHYKGYTIIDYERQLASMEKLQGKFLHSSYPSDILADYTRRNGWHQVEIKKAIAVSHTVKRLKTEVLTANYPI